MDSMTCARTALLLACCALLAGLAAADAKYAIISTPLEKGVTKEIKFTANNSIETFHFALCNSLEKCNILSIDGADANGLGYSTYKASTKEVKQGLSAQKSKVQGHTGPSTFPVNKPLVLTVKRDSDDEVQFWLSNTPDKVVTMRAEKIKSTMILYYTLKLKLVTESLCKVCGLTGPEYSKCEIDEYNNYAYAVLPGVDVVTRPEEQIGEKFSCSPHAPFCQLQVSHVKEFSTQHEWDKGAPQVTEELFPLVDSVLEADLKGAKERHALKTAIAQQSITCSANAGYSGWLAAKPRFYVKRGVVATSGDAKSGCGKWSLTTRVPLLALDGSIAGDRNCVAVKP